MESCDSGRFLLIAKRFDPNRLLITVKEIFSCILPSLFSVNQNLLWLYFSRSCYDHVESKLKRVPIDNFGRRDIKDIMQYFLLTKAWCSFDCYDRCDRPKAVSPCSCRAIVRSFSLHNLFLVRNQIENQLQCTLGNITIVLICVHMIIAIVHDCYDG